MRKPRHSRTLIACNNCRAQRLRCEPHPQGLTKPCARCHSKGRRCVYTPIDSNLDPAPNSSPVLLEQPNAQPVTPPPPPSHTHSANPPPNPMPPTALSYNTYQSYPSHQNNAFQSHPSYQNVEPPRQYPVNMSGVMPIESNYDSQPYSQDALSTQYMAAESSYYPIPSSHAQFHYPQAPQHPESLSTPPVSQYPYMQASYTTSSQYPWGYPPH
uniref:Zn(2)-C6 fungal-type domain-containing protein n=1 Tax=Moniliophthora roreri TaxID=221103 RepID=A0A0W0FD19_MONRR